MIVLTFDWRVEPVTPNHLLCEQAADQGMYAVFDDLPFYAGVKEASRPSV